MIYSIKKILFGICFNSSLFLILLIGIQNSENKSKVRFINSESVELPLSFILGMSFISGSIAGSFINFNEFIKKN